MPENRSADVLYRDARKSAVAGLIVNALLGILKLVAGVVSQSFALLADAINSLGDLVTATIVLVGLRIAQSPPDAEHPYGHTRAEGIAACIIATLFIISAISVGWHAIRTINEPHEIPPKWTLWLAAINIAATEGMYRYSVWISKRTGSASVCANAWDHRSNALSAIAVLVGLSAVRIFGKEYAWADHAASLVVAAAILWAGILLLYSSAMELMDRQADPELVNQVRVAAVAVNGVENVEKLWVRKSGLEYFTDIHVQVAPDLTIAEGHRIGHDVKDRLLEQVPAMRDVMVHLEPSVSS